METILLSNGIHSALVSDEDYSYMVQWSWQYENGYARRDTTIDNVRIIIYMHKVIACRINLIGNIDHKDGNKLNNQRENLRTCTQSQNVANQKLAKHNTTGFKGVYYLKRTGKYTAQINFNRTKKHLGYFNSAIEAARAYDKAAIRYFGEFASTNKMLGLIS